MVMLYFLILFIILEINLSGQLPLEEIQFFFSINNIYC